MKGNMSEYFIADKYNFFKIDRELKDKFDISCGITSFSIFPIQDITVRWLRYIEEVNSKLKKFNKRISLENPELSKLLLILSKIKTENQKQKRDLLRALGAICEDVFIGPYSVVIELLQDCNTNCLHCWVHSENGKKKQDSNFFKGKMNIEMFRHIAGKARAIGVERVSLLANGEPLMHPEITQIINICRENRLKFEAITNGVFMVEPLSRLMVDSGVGIVTVSLPAASAKSYTEICPKSPMEDFYKVKKNIKDFIAYRDKVDKNIELRMTHVIHNMNCHDLFEFVQMDIALGVDVVLFKIIQLDESNYHLKLKEEQIGYLKANLPEVIDRLKAHGIKTDELIYTFLNFYQDAQGLRTKGYFSKKGCLAGWSFCDIHAGGEVFFCCGNKLVDMLNGDNLDKLWFSKKYNFYRIAAKNLEKNKDVKFTRGERLFDGKCESCENINEHLYILKAIREYSLEGFL